MGRSKQRKRRWYWENYDWDPMAQGPYHEGCSFHDGRCTEDGELHFYAAPNDQMVLGLCDNHRAKLDPELAGFEVTHAPLITAEDAISEPADRPAAG